MRKRILAIVLVVTAAIGWQVLLRGRRAELARMSGRLGRRAAVNRAKRVFADAARREVLDEELQLHTAEEVARTLGQMKGALMKIGQLASFVDDGMPEPVRQALEQLQQSAPPMAPELAARVIEEELGASPERAFAEWDPVPIAAASIGQVHRAMTHDGRAVAVKVQYPDAAEAIAADLAGMDLAALGVPLLFKNMDMKGISEELRERLTEELDYCFEAENQRMFADWYRGHPFIHVPDVLGELSTRRVLTTDLAEGARFQEMESWSQEEKNLAGEAIYRFVFRSLYRFHAFNGDPHPGNYLFRPGGQVTFLDFGLVRRYEQRDIDLALGLADAAVIRPDIARLRQASVAAGYFPEDAPLTDEEIAEYSMQFWEPIAARGVHTITSEWATQINRNYLLGAGAERDFVKHAMIPPQFAILQRINLGLFAILGRLEATADWRGIVEEIWPIVDGPPATPMGEAEARWLEGRVRRTG